MAGKIYDEASSVDADEGEVIVDGPDGVAVSLTPEAAEETGNRLIGKACEAAGRQRLKRPADKERAPGERAEADPAQ